MFIDKDVHVKFLKAHCGRNRKGKVRSRGYTLILERDNPKKLTVSIKIK